MAYIEISNDAVGDLRWLYFMIQSAKKDWSYPMPDMWSLQCRINKCIKHGLLFEERKAGRGINYEATELGKTFLPKDSK